MLKVLLYWAYCTEDYKARLFVSTCFQSLHNIVALYLTDIHESFSFNAWQTHRMYFLKISNKWEVAYYKHWFGEQNNAHNLYKIRFFRLLSLPLRYIKRQSSWHGGTKRDLRVEEQGSDRKMEKERARKGKETGRHVLGNGKAFKWDSNLGDMSACLQLGSLTFSQLSTGAKAAFFPLIV